MMPDEVKSLRDVATNLSDNTESTKHTERMVWDIKSKLDTHLAVSSEHADEFERIRCIVEGENGNNGLRQNVQRLVDAARSANRNSLGLQGWLMVLCSAAVAVVGILQLMRGH